MIQLYKEERDRMEPRAQEARIIGYTATYGVYQVITTTGKRKLAKNPRTIDQSKEDSDEEEEARASEWPTKPVQDLEDIADGRQGRNYGWHCPEKEGCPEKSHEGDQQGLQTPERKKPPPLDLDSPSQ